MKVYSLSHVVLIHLKQNAIHRSYPSTFGTMPNVSTSDWDTNKTN